MPKFLFLWTMLQWTNKLKLEMISLPQQIAIPYLRYMQLQMFTTQRSISVDHISISVAQTYLFLFA